MSNKKKIKQSLANFSSLKCHNCSNITGLDSQIVAIIESDWVQETI